MSIAVQESRENALTALFGLKKALVGTVHLRPLPGTPSYRGETLASIREAALRDAMAYVENGVEGLIVENSGDVPFLKPDLIGPETVSYLTALTARIVETAGVPVGVNCLANAVIPAIAVAHAAGGKFVRANQWVNAYVANEGFVEGRAAEALRFRTQLGAHDVRVFADVHVKHGSHAIVADRPVAEQARDAHFFAADVLIATGSRTGDATSVDEIVAVRSGSDLPVIVGSGLALDNVDQLFAVADGAIVGSSLKVDGAWWNAVDPARVRALVERADDPTQSTEP